MTSPYRRARTVALGEELVAVPAIELDAALVHSTVGDERGNAAFTGPDLYFDDLMLEAAPTGRRFVSVERIVPTGRSRRRRGASSIACGSTA